jgi:hypothetical protein
MQGGGAKKVHFIKIIILSFINLNLANTLPALIKATPLQEGHITVQNPSATPLRPNGRLVLILERELHPRSRSKLYSLLQRMARQPEPTFIASLAQPAFMGAIRLDERGQFYNTDMRGHNLVETFQLMPWREIWMLRNGELWHASPAL